MIILFVSVLSTSANIKNVIVNCGGFQAITKTLNHTDLKIRLHCTMTLRNLSDCVVKQLNQDMVLEPELIQAVLQQLVMRRPENAGQEGEVKKLSEIAVFAAGVLSNLTCNPKVKIGVCKANGIPILIQAISDIGNLNDFCEDAVTTLKHIMHEHQFAMDAQKQLLSDENAVSALLRCLNSHMSATPAPNWRAIKAIIGLVRNLSLPPENQECLRRGQGPFQKGFVYVIKEILCFVAETHLVRVTVAKVEFNFNCISHLSYSR